MLSFNGECLLSTTLVTAESLRDKLAKLIAPVTELDEGVLVSATYDGDKRLAVLKFYDPKRDIVVRWEDNTGHRPYCVPGDTVLLGDNVTIATVEEGNQTLGVTGEVAVQGKSVRQYNGRMTRIKGMGLLPFSITPDHPLLIAHSLPRGRKDRKRFAEIEWRLPKDLSPKNSDKDGDYLVFPILRGRHERDSMPLSVFSKRRDGKARLASFPLNKETSWLLGLYVAEGSCGGRRGAVFSLHEKETEIIRRIKSVANSLGYSVRLVRGTGHGVRLHLGGQVISRAMEEWCGSGAHNKKIPDFILFHKNLGYLQALLDGYTSGDGSSDWTRNTKVPHEIQTMCSTSKVLILQLQQAFARFGIFAQAKVQHEAGEYVIEGRKVHQRQAFTLSFLRAPKYTSAKKIGDSFYVPIRKVDSVDFRGLVYNIETSDSTYLVNNAVVHNCYTKRERDALGPISSRKDVVAIEEEQKLDLLSDTRMMVRKIVTTDPLAIGGGSGGNSIRDQIEAWEADIKYYENYVYDRNLKVGTYYKIQDGNVIPVEKEVPETVTRSLNQILSKNTGEQTKFIKEWAELLGQPLCQFKRIATDIEVANEEGRVPDPEKADREVIAVSFYNDKESLVYLAARNLDDSLGGAKTSYKPVVFPDEASMIRAAFSKMMDYPFLITFNGDDFDLRYLVHRAEKLGISEDEIPIYLMRQEASLRHGVHVDLYRFFNNKSIQIYVYNKSYTERTLNGISEAVLGKSKIEFEGNVADLPLLELSNYCLNDSQLTYELTSINSSQMMNILLVMARIAKMPMNDVARLGVSNWIRSMLFYEHRRMNAIIPRQNELALKGGASSEAIIKGKKYKGGLVIEPKPGVHFNVSVLDFASLYPSIIKVYNLSYETVNCPHEECRTNRIPDTEHWRCRKRNGIESLVIGSLRDLRVSHFKQLARDKTISKEERELSAVVSQGLKVLLNASYGSFGFETFALYCLPVAEATAALGRYAITRTIEKCNQEGISVIYSDSVTGERCVTVRDPEGQVRVLPIQNLFDEFEQIVIRPDGKEEVHPVGWKTLATGIEDGSTAWKDIGAVIRHRNTKRIFRVWDKFGSTRVTQDHSLVVSSKNGRVLSKPEELAGKHLLRVASMPESGDVTRLDLYGLLKDVRYSSVYKGRTKTLEAHCDGEWVWYGWTNRKKPVKLKRFIEVGTAEFKAFVELLGAYIPEGSSSTPDTTSSRLGASIACSDTDWLRRQRENYRCLFQNAEPSIVVSSPGVRNLTYTSSSGLKMEVAYRDRTHKLQMMNKVSAVMFKALCGQTSAGKHLPDFIFNVPREFKLLMLENILKGDGSRVFGPLYSQDYRERNFRYETKSLRLVSGLSTLLLQLGIKHTVGYRPSKKTYSISTCSAYNNTRRPPRVAEEDYTGYVYDLSVEGYHTFADSCGSIVLKNTDSLFIENPDRQKINAVISWAESDLGVELDIDKSYRYVAFSERKKNYFGVLQDGTADIKGLTGKKSVSGDTPILARIDGAVRYTNVERVYREFVGGHTVDLPTITEEKKTVWARIGEAVEHDVPDTYEIRTSRGRRLKLSGDHSVFFIDSFGRLYCKETKAVKTGEILVGARYIPETGNRSSLDLKEIIEGTKERGGLLFSVGPHSTTGTGIPQTLPITTELALLLGIFTAEGSMSSTAGSRSNEIKQSEETNPEVCKAIIDSWSRTFGWDIKRFWAPSKRTFCLPTLYAAAFRKLCGGNSREKHVPDFVFGASLDVVRAYLRGLFSGDGFADGRRISIASMSPNLLEQVGYLLTYFDIDYRIRRASNARFGLHYSQLSIVGTSSRLRFQNEIGFLQPRFQVIPKQSARNKELLPITTDGLIWIKKRMLNRLGMTRFRHINIHDSRFYNVSLLARYNGLVAAMAAYADPVESALLSSISSMLNSQDATYDEVVSVERTSGSVKMYDFSVPKYERFVAGNLPSLLHNSQTPDFLKEAFYQSLKILGTVYAPEDFERAKKEIKTLLTQTVSRLRNKEIPMQDLAFRVMIGKAISGYSGTTPQHVRAAKLLQERGREVKAGEIISYVKTKTPPNVKPVELARPDDVDVDKYLEYASSMFDQMLDSLGFSFDEIMGSTTLDAFWS